MIGDANALILMYHRIAEETCDPWSLCVTPSHFQEQLQILRRLACPVQLRHLISDLDEKKLRRGSVVVTFDDGYADNFCNAKPLLAQFDVHATIFVVSGAVGDSREFWSDELERLFLHPGKLPDNCEIQINGRTIRRELGQAHDYSVEEFQRHCKWNPFDEPPTSRHGLFFELWKELRPLPIQERRRHLDELWDWSGSASRTRSTHRPLTEEELRILAKSEIFEIGAHTVSHPQLSGISVEEQGFEIAESRNRLEEITDQKVTSFAYPYGWHGDFNEETIPLLEENGFTGACTTIQGSVFEDTNRYLLPRLPVGDWNGEQFECKLLEWFDGKGFL